VSASKKRPAPKGSGRSTHDEQRIVEILRLANGAESDDARQAAEWARRLVIRDRDPTYRRTAARKRLERIEQAAHELLAALEAIPPRADETLHLLAALTRLPALRTSLEDEYQTIRSLVAACSEALKAFPKVGHRPTQSWRGPILQLATQYQARTGKRPVSTPDGEFAELVTLIFGIEDPSKHIRLALRGNRRKAR
jgi:hypothetical protein